MPWFHDRAAVAPWPRRRSALMSLTLFESLTSFESTRTLDSPVSPPTFRSPSQFAASAVYAAAAAAAALALLLTGCGKQTDTPAAAPRPPAEVGVVTVTPGTVGLTDELPGRLEASRVAQVRARAAGILQRRLFKEGSDVEAGQPLFEIDAAPYRATLASSQAGVARAEANLMQASAQAERYKPLLDANAISKQDYVNAVAAQKQAQADVAAGKAALQTARINLGYAAVTAPIAGRIGRALVTEGALVGQGEATQLAVIQQIDPMYVNFTQSAGEVLRLRAAIASGRLLDGAGGVSGVGGVSGTSSTSGPSGPSGKSGVRGAGSAASGAPARSAEVRVVLEDGSVHAQPGRLLFSDLTVDATSGQITLRAELPNPDGALLPGMYVRVRIEQAQASDAVLLPQQAVTRAPAGDSVRLVAADGTVSSRQVLLGGAQNGQWVVLDGLRAGEQVVVDGFQKVQGNAPVKAVPWRPGAPASGASAAPIAATAPSAASAPAAGAAPAPAPAPAASR